MQNDQLRLESEARETKLRDGFVAWLGFPKLGISVNKTI